MDTELARLQSVLQITTPAVNVLPIYAMFQRVEELNSKQAHIEALWRHLATISKTPYVQKSLAHMPTHHA